MMSGKATILILIALSRLRLILPGIMYNLSSNMFEMLAIRDFRIISLRKLLIRLGLFGILVTMRFTAPEMMLFSSSLFRIWLF
jgi:hypothetical protein